MEGGVGVLEHRGLGNRVRSELAATAILLLMVLIPAQGAVAAVDYTGSVVPMDSLGQPKDTFARGDMIYVNVSLEYRGSPYDGAIQVRLERSDGSVVGSFNARTNNPAVGYYNSTMTGLHLNAVESFDGSMRVYEVVAYYTGSGPPYEIGRMPIIVLATGLHLDPSMDPHYPGQVMNVDLFTSHTTEVFYVQVVNESGATKANWTTQVAPFGAWSVVWMIPDDFPDGLFSMNVRAASDNALWYSTMFEVAKFLFMADSDRSIYLTGETAQIYYMVLDVATLNPSTGISIEYSAYWINASGADVWSGGSLAGSEGTHEFTIPSDIALYSDVWLTYWANETSSGRSYEDTVTLGIGLLWGDVRVTGGTFLPGDMVEVVVYARAGADDLPGATVNLTVELDGVVLPAYGSSDMVTDVSGAVGRVIHLDPGASQGTYIVKAALSKSGHSLLTMTSFVVAFDGSIDVNFDKAYYYSGDTAFIQLRPIWNNQELTNQSVTYLILQHSVVMQTGPNVTGIVEYKIAQDFYGTIEVQAVANVDGFIIMGFSFVEVYIANMWLSSDMSSYVPGDTVTFNFEIETNLADGAIEWEIVEDSWSSRVANGTPAFTKVGSFSYTVPTNWSSDSYTATLFLDFGFGSPLQSSVTVTRDMNPPPGLSPFLRIDNPVEGATVVIPVVRMNGSTESGVTLFVNGLLLIPETDSTFSLNLPLVEGTNLITIVAAGGLGNTRTETRNVTFANPMPVLEAQMSQLMLDVAEAQSDLFSAWSELNDSMAGFAASWDDLNASLTSVITVWDLVNTTQLSITSMQAQLNGLRDMVTAAYGSSNSSQAGLTSAMNMINSLQSQLDSAQGSLNATRSDLSTVQTQLDTLETDLENAQSDISGKPTNSSVLMWAVIAIVASSIISLGLIFLMRKRTTS